MKNHADSLLTLGAARFDRDTGRLLDADGGVIPMPAQSKDILLTLVAHADQDVAKEMLVSAVSGATTLTDESLVQSVAEIRNALGDKANTIIQTVPGVGYRLNTMPLESAGRERNILKYVGLAIAVLPVLAFIVAILLSLVGG